MCHYAPALGIQSTASSTSRVGTGFRPGVAAARGSSAIRSRMRSHSVSVTRRIRHAVAFRAHSRIHVEIGSEAGRVDCPPSTGRIRGVVTDRSSTDGRASSGPPTRSCALRVVATAVAVGGSDAGAGLSVEAKRHAAEWQTSRRPRCWSKGAAQLTCPRPRRGLQTQASARRRRPTARRPASPAAMRALVDGSGTAITSPSRTSTTRPPDIDGCSLLSPPTVPKWVLY